MAKIEKACTLHCNTGKHDKYYIMVQWDDGNLTVYFGRRGAKPQEKNYTVVEQRTNRRSWLRLKGSKIAKGYSDVSDDDILGIPTASFVSGSVGTLSKSRIVDVEDADDLRNYVNSLFE